MMASPLFNIFGSRGGTTNEPVNMRNPINMMQQFVKFKNGFQGNAKEECMKIMNSGKLTNEQINQAKGMVGQMQQLINMFIRNGN